MRYRFGLLLVALMAGYSATADADERWSLQAQTTFVLQATPRFRSPYQGPNSLAAGPQAKETFDLTLYAGFRPWSGTEIWVNPEIDQGFGLSNTLGVAGFPSGEAYKVGKRTPYPKLPRWFLRQTVDLGGTSNTVDPNLNQFASRTTSNRLVLTVGKFAVVDVFDTNDQAHDPRRDFLNWTIVDAGTFDYAANAWGYTYGAAAELYDGPWTVRAGVFALSDIPNSEKLDSSFGQNELVGEVEHRHSIGGRAGAVKVTVFRNLGNMGRFADAIRLADSTGQPADISAARHRQSRVGVSLDAEQAVSKTVSLFVRGGVVDGNLESFEFTDVDRAVSGGLTVKGTTWGRPDDRFGLAGVINAISAVRERFLNAGGLGILVGDGQLPHPASERIMEAYYDLAVAHSLHVSIDGQLIDHPGYNRDRGPVPAGSLRLHAQF